MFGQKISSISKKVVRGLSTASHYIDDKGNESYRALRRTVGTGKGKGGLDPKYSLFGR